MNRDDILKIKRSEFRMFEAFQWLMLADAARKTLAGIAAGNCWDKERATTEAQMKRYLRRAHDSLRSARKLSLEYK